MKKFMALAVLCAVLCMAGCKDNSADSAQDSQQTAQETADANETADTKETEQAQTVQSGDTDSAASVLTSELAADTVIISSEKGGAEMDITFGDFFKEYKYYLASCGLSVDTDPAYSEPLTSRREYIANYLINDKLMERMFERLYPEGFTDEELARIQADADAGKKQLIDAIKAQLEAAQTLGSEVTDEELQKQAEEGFRQLMDNCGLTDDDFYGWQRSTVIKEKLTEKVGEGVTCERSEAEDAAKRMAEQAKADYESDPASYDADSYKSIYLPEGARYVKHILLKLDSLDTEDIYNLRNDGKDDEADKLRAEKLAELDEKLAEVNARVDAGEDFETLMQEYSGDSDLTISYLVVPDTGRYMDGFAECALGIEEVGGTAVCSTDYGYHIIKYIEPATVSDEEYQSTVDGLVSYLTDYYKSQKLVDELKQLRGEYNYVIDRNALMLGEESAEG